MTGDADRRKSWATPRHGQYPQCYFCGAVAMTTQKVGDRTVPTCGAGHKKGEDGIVRATGFDYEGGSDD